MAYFSQNTIETVKEMYGFWREHGSARISCTASFCASARSALSALRRADSAWYGVKLVAAPLSEGECFLDEKGYFVCMMLTMEKAVGKTGGTRAKMLREAGMLVERSGESKIALPAKSAAEIDAHVAQLKPTLTPGHAWKLWDALGEKDPEGKVLLMMRKALAGENDDGLRKILHKSLAQFGPEDEALLQTAVEYWEPRLDELLRDPTILLN